jgi:peptidyl-prolyl cis-trans isomerase C
VFPLLLALLLVSACSQTPDAQTTETAAPGAATSALPAGAALGSQPAKPVPAQLPAVVARVNGEAITKGDFERAVQAMEGRAGSPVPAEQRDSVYRSVLDDLIGIRLLQQEAKARKVTIADADVTAQLAQIRNQFPTPDAFDQMLKQRKLTVEQVRSDTQRDLTIAKLLTAEVEPKAKVDPQQVAEFYKSNPDQFTQSERVRASHILISIPRDGDAAAKTQARARAEAVLKDVRSGRDFAALAKEYSQDPGSAVQGGDLGYFQQGQMVGPFNDTAFSLKPGTTSGLVETEFGFHIIRVVDKQPGGTVSLDEVRPRLEQYLLNQNRRQHTEAFVTALKARGKVELFI